MKSFFAVLTTVYLGLGMAWCQQGGISTKQESIETAEIKTIESPEKAGRRNS